MKEFSSEANRCPFGPFMAPTDMFFEPCKRNCYSLRVPSALGLDAGNAAAAVASKLSLLRLMSRADDKDLPRRCTIAKMSLIESSRQEAVSGMGYFLRNFSHVPDDRLMWTPTPAAKSPIRVAAHTALYAGRFASMIRDRWLPAPDNLTEWLAEREAEEVAITGREENGEGFPRGHRRGSRSPRHLDARRTGDVNRVGPGMVDVDEAVDGPGRMARDPTRGADRLSQTCWDDQQVYVGAEYFDSSCAHIVLTYGIIFDVKPQSKSETVNIRASAVQKALLAKAAQLENMNVSQFVLSKSLRAAEVVVTEHRKIGRAHV